jgi:hypothetical protein
MESEMRIYSKVPQRLPGHPALIREGAGSYAIWTGRNWHGSVDKVGRFWAITTPASPVETFETFNGAMTDAHHRALRAEGRV